MGAGAYRSWCLCCRGGAADYQGELLPDYPWRSLIRGQGELVPML
jgi:hypothetical protein